MKVVCCHEGRLSQRRLVSSGYDPVGHGRHFLLSQNDSAFSRCLHGHCCVSGMSSSTASPFWKGACYSHLPTPEPFHFLLKINEKLFKGLFLAL